MALLLLATGTGNTLLNARMLALRAYAPASLLQPALKLAAQVALGRLSGGGAAEVQGQKQKQQRRREAKRSERTRLFLVAGALCDLLGFVLFQAGACAWAGLSSVRERLGPTLEPRRRLAQPIGHMIEQR